MTALALSILITIALLAVSIVIFFKLFYTQVPQNTALIVNDKKVFFSNIVTLPTDKKQFMEILPVQIKTVYLDSNGLFCKEKLLLNVVITYNLCVNFSTESVLMAAKRIGIANVANPSAVSEALTPIITDIVKKLIEQFPLEVLEKDQGKVRKAIVAKLTNQLDGYNLEYINIDKLELTALDKLEHTNQKLFKQQQTARLEWDIEQKKVLQKRLQLIVEHQQDLSRKIKQMIESYQTVIREKIKFFLNRELLK